MTGCVPSPFPLRLPGGARSLSPCRRGENRAGLCAIARHVTSELPDSFSSIPCRPTQAGPALLLANHNYNQTYAVFLAVSAFGIALSHGIPLAKLKCLSEKRRKEMASRLGGEPGGARPSINRLQPLRLFTVSAKQVRPVSERLFQSLLRAPLGHLRMVAADQNLRHLRSAILRRPGVVRKIQQSSRPPATIHRTTREIRPLAATTVAKRFILRGRLI